MALLLQCMAGANLVCGQASKQPLRNSSVYGSKQKLYAFLIIYSPSLCHLQKFRLAQSLNVSCSCLNSNSTETCQKLQSALNVTCRLYDANRILPNISLPDDTAQEVLEIMSEKSVQDACIWTNETLHSNDSPGLPSNVDCSDVSTLGGVCSQWNEFTSIMKIESKVDLLRPTIDEDEWFGRHSLTRSNFYSGC